MIDLLSPIHLRAPLEYASELLNRSVEIGSTPCMDLWSFCEIVFDLSLLMYAKAVGISDLPD
jgi:hypothetical protein